jgi:hypothetical protein
MMAFSVDAGICGRSRGGRAHSRLSAAAFVPALAVAAAMGALLAGGTPAAANDERLPLPAIDLPRHPALPASVVTAGGQRLLLADAPQVRVAYEPDTNRVTVHPAGWWVINYPIERIEGVGPGGVDAFADRVLGRSAGEVRNWYARSAGEPGPEPAAPTGPAPIELTPHPTLIVDAGHADADDGNDGSLQRPLRTIAAAVARAQAGSVIHVMPGVYRESVVIEAAGTADAPIRIEGVRGDDGSMPVITGNDPFPPDAWTEVEGVPNVWRADHFTAFPGTMSDDGRMLIERDVIHELQPGEYVQNRASRRFLDTALSEQLHNLSEGDRHEGHTWQRITADEEGFIDLAEKIGGADEGGVYWLSAWVWVEPGDRQSWHPDYPEPIFSRAFTAAGFRAQRATGVRLASQMNQYRVWINGDRVSRPHHLQPDDRIQEVALSGRNLGEGEEWNNFNVNEGWNHVVFQIDTTARPDMTRFRLRGGRGMPDWIASATRPQARDNRPDGEGLRHIGAFMALGPIPTDGRDRGVYVRLDDGVNPNDRPLDLAARTGHLLHVTGPFVEVRGFEVRHGASPQQQALVQIAGEGNVLEGCLVRDGEVRGVGLNLFFPQTSVPQVVRNNWVVNMGNLGMGANANSTLLNADNLDDPPRRGRAIIEYNHVASANWAGYPSMWESGAMKFFRMTGCVIRFNTLVGGHGPGVWLDWEHYNNRVEGNLILDGWGVGVGVEASPGPNLVASNVSRNLRAGQVWFRAGILSWDSGRTWMLHNTVDGGDNDERGWQNYRGTEGMRRGYRANRGSRWCPMEDRRYSYVNNLIVGVNNAIGAHSADTVLGNRTDRGRNAEPLATPPTFANPERGDYRLIDADASDLRAEAYPNGSLVRYDFFGLLRFPDEPGIVGAFRRDPAAGGSGGEIGTEIEVEYADGTMTRR